jgi:RNA 2',3'-cyclic 3'-phosphodiesterase
VRTFLACCIDAAAAAQLYAALEPLRHGYRGGAYRWTPAENYHVTLRFFGEIEPRDAERVVEIVRPIATLHQPIECRTAAVQPLPGARQPKVIALSIESAGRVEALAAEVNAALEDDFGPPDKTFKAHLTVIRCRRGARFVAPAGAFEYPLTFTSLALFESETSGNGPRYTPLQTFRLGEDQVRAS